MWCSDRVFSYMGKLWWVDLSQGLLSCDPLSTEPQLSFVPFPNLRPTRHLGQHRIRRDPSSQRCVDLSDGKLRYVVLTTRCRVPRIRFWTLADVEAAGKWTQDYELSCGDIWKDHSFNQIGLPYQVPVFALIHPTDPQMVYFFQRGLLFSFDLRRKTVIECFSNDIGLDEPSSSSSFILPWKLPSSFKVSPVSLFREQSYSPFDRLATSFGEACDNAIVDMEFHRFISMALADLNKGVTEETKKFRESESLYLCYFDDEADDTVEYAHLNFTAESASRNVTVFAELTRKVDGQSSWTLSLCKILTKSFHDDAALFIGPTVHELNIAKHLRWGQ
ncbi:hypothetical protein PR202_gb27241 [Eleusine coracana subsp. coracana]|uniref:DUF1618 domain-containing protein n=1 Tax=Eleusine coracana subsp. coracana TaxID=191504 RepID=A0AAV5FR43_ELECO|nr:hypothetical protein PR202_gb27241 [Eleusine coracana subsp. coracana]